MNRRASIDRSAKIKNINIIQKKLQESLIFKKDSFQQIILTIYKIGVNNTFTKDVVFKGNIFDALDWCLQWQQKFKSQFDGYLNNIRNNSSRKLLIKYTKKLRDFIKQSGLYSDKCFKILDKFVSDFSNKNPQTKLTDSKMYSYIQGKGGIKQAISLYRKLVTNQRVNAIKSLKNYYIDSDSKQNYILGISGINKAIQNNQVLTISMKNSGVIKVRPKSVRPQKWVLFGQLIDDNGQYVKNVIICQSDVKK